MDYSCALPATAEAPELARHAEWLATELEHFIAAARRDDLDGHAIDPLVTTNSDKSWSENR